MPAPDTDGFRAALIPYLADLPPGVADDVRDSTVDIYDAHRAAGAAALGPAVFLDMPGYVAAGAGSGASVPELLAEAYLTSLGTWLSRLEDDELDRHGQRMGAPAALGGQWGWFRGQLAALR